MASSVDPIVSMLSGQENTNVSSSYPHGVGSMAPSLPLLKPIVASPVISGPSSRRPFVESMLPRSSASSDNGVGGNGVDVSPISRMKKPAWNFPASSAAEVGSVMDTNSWPALSESARSSPKSVSSDSLKVSLASSPSGKQASVNQNSQSPRDKIMNQGAVTINGDAFSGASNDGTAMPSSLPLLGEASQTVPDKQPYPENHCLSNQNNNNNNNDNDNNKVNDRDLKQKAIAFSNHSNGKNDHQRGVGVRKSNNSHRGNNEWSHRNFGRGVHMQQMHQQQGVGPFPRPPSVANAPFIAPSLPLMQFPNHIGFTDFQSPVYYVAAPLHPESFSGVPFSSPQVLLYPATDPLQAMLLKQIDYYFSSDNLCKDVYLRQNMDAEGWVPITLIAGFNRVKLLTNNIQYILDTLQQSSMVEVQGEKIRKRNDWKTWVLPPNIHLALASTLSQTTNFGNLTPRTDNANNGGLNGSAKNEGIFARSASAKLNNRKPINDIEEGEAQACAYSDRVWNIRTLIRNDTM